MIGMINVVDDHARRDQVLDRIDGEGGERVDLLRDAHRPELGGHARPGAGRDHQAGEHRRQLLCKRDADGRADEALLVEDAQRRDRLLCGHRARKEADQHDDRQRSDAHELHLLEEQAQAERRRNSAAIALPSMIACSPK